MKKKGFFSQVKKNTAVSGILLLLQLLVLVFFLLQYTVSYSEDFFSRCEDFFPKQLSKTCGSYENNFSTLLAKFPLGFRNKKIVLGVTSKACNSTKEQWGHCSPFNFFLIVGGKKILFLIVGGKNILFPHSPHCQLLAMSCPKKGDPKLKLFCELGQ